jgi:hypothetical protein
VDITKEEHEMTLAEQINAALDANKTITVATYGRVTRIKAKHRKVWGDVGFPFFKTDSKGATLMIDGQSQGKPRYSCIDGAKVTAA